MKELFESLEKTLRSQQQMIKVLKHRLDMLESCFFEFNNCLEESYNCKVDSDAFNEFSTKHGEKFKKLKEYAGDDYEPPMRSIYDDIKSKKGQEGFDEDAAVDGILGEAIQMLDRLKGKLNPEQAAAIEEVKEEVKEAALENDAANSDGDAAKENFDEEPDEWSEDMLEEDWKKNKSKKGY